MGVGAHGVRGRGGGVVGRSSGVCLLWGVFGRRVCWARCRPVRCAMVRAGLRVGLCCCSLAGCRPLAVCARAGRCLRLRASCGARGRLPVPKCGAKGLFGPGAHRLRIRLASPRCEDCPGPSAGRTVAGDFCMCQRGNPSRVVAPVGVPGSYGAPPAWEAAGRLRTAAASGLRGVLGSPGTQGRPRSCAPA